MKSSRHVGYWPISSTGIAGRTRRCGGSISGCAISRWKTWWMSGLVCPASPLVSEAGGTPKAPIHRYRFPPQETELRGGDNLHNLGGDKLGSVAAISFENYTVDIKKRRDSAAIHPQAVFAHTYVNAQVLADSLVRLGESVADHGLCGEGPYQAARDLLLREVPRVGSQELHRDGETTVQAAVRLCGHLAGGILPIQGPPGVRQDLHWRANDLRTGTPGQNSRHHGEQP